MSEKNIVAQIRKKHNLTQEELAHFLRVSYTSVNAWESGRRVPQEQMKKILLAIFETEDITLLSGSIDEPRGLNRTDSGFVSSVIDYGKQRDDQPFTHGIGRWYGSLPSFLVRDVIRFLSTDFGNCGLSVVNFSGSGTVPLELALIGRKCVAIDANPVSVLLTTVKTKLGGFVSDEKVVIALEQILNSHNDYSCDFVNRGSNLIIKENKWISTDTRQALLKIITGINSINNEGYLLLITAALISIVVDFCCIDKRCTNHYVFKQAPKYTFEDIFSALRTEVLKYVELLKRLDGLSNGYEPPKVIWGNACQLPLEDSVADLVFSHPPYGTTINYHSITRVQLSVLELIEFKETLFAARDLGEQCRRRDLSSGTLERFKKNASIWISEAYRVLKQGGLLVVVIGDSRDSGKLSHPFTDIILECEKLGFINRELFIWVTNHKAGMHVKRKGHHIDHNYIIIMEKK